MTTEDQAPLPNGTVVKIDDRRCPGLYKVVNKGPVNYTLVPVDTQGNNIPGRGAKMPRYLLQRHDPNTPLTDTPIPPSVFFLGEVVTTANHPGLWVVMADKVDRVNVAKLGGNDNRYLRVHPAALTRVPLGEVAARLMQDTP